MGSLRFPARERTCWAIGAEQCNAHHLAGALLDSLRALISVEVRLGESGETKLTLIPVDSSSIIMASVIALRAVLDAGYTGRRSRGGRGRVRVHCQRANSARHVDDAGLGRLAQKRQHRLVNGEGAEHVGFPHCAHFIEGYDCSGGSSSRTPGGTRWPLFVFEIAALLTSTSRRPYSLRMRSTAVAIEPDPSRLVVARCVRPDLFGHSLAPLEVARPDGTATPCVTSAFAT